MKKTTNVLLMIAVVLPIVLLFWPFAEWDVALSLILRVIPSVAVQVLLCRICKMKIVTAIPLLLTGILAAWGTYLFFASPHWSGATYGDLLRDYVSPFIGCAVALLIYLLIKKISSLHLRDRVI